MSNEVTAVPCGAKTCREGCLPQVIVKPLKRLRKEEQSSNEQRWENVIWLIWSQNLVFLFFFLVFLAFHFAFAKHLCECKLQKLQHSKPRAELENLRVHFGTRHFLPKLYTNVKIT